MSRKKRSNSCGAATEPNSTNVPATEMIALDTAPQDPRPVIASETLDLNNILQEKNPLFAERPLSGIVRHYFESCIVPIY